MIDYSDINRYFSEKKDNAKSSGGFQRLLNASERQETATVEQFEAELCNAFGLIGNKKLGEVLATIKDDDGWPPVAYALAGNLCLLHFQWLLEKLKSNLASYSDTNHSLISIAVTFGQEPLSLNRLKLLFNAGYKPSKDELKKALFYAVYYGHIDLANIFLNRINLSLWMEEENQSELVLDALKDADGNSCLDIAVLSNNKTSLDRIAYFYSLRQIPINYDELIRALIKRSGFDPAQKDMLSYLRKRCANTAELTQDWIKIAINVNNIAILSEFINSLPYHIDISIFIESAREQSCNREQIIDRLNEEHLAKVWTKTLLDIVLKRLEGYIHRQKSQLEQLAQDDGLPKNTYKETNNLSDAQRRSRECKQALEHLFYGPYFIELKQIYKTFSFNDRDVNLFAEKIVLNRQELIRKIKGSNKDRAGFNQLIQTAINHAAYPEGPGSIHPAPVIFINPSEPLDIYYEDSAQFSAKQKHFIDRFVEQFDQTYQLYKCLSNGEVIKKPGETDRLADMAKTVATGLLPNINISAPMFGIPLPISMSLPSGIAVAAVIDLLMFIRDHTERNQAERAGHFFDGWTLRDRVNAIYTCAEFLATRFQDQIKILSHNESLPRMADMAVARIFRYAMGSKGHSVSSAPSMIGTLFRKAASTFINVGPEPEVVRKSLIEVSIDALSTYEHKVAAWDTEDRRFLILDEQISQDWTVKGIFEHTGIRSKGKTYKGMNQDVKKYGYAYGSEEEVKKRGLQLTNIIPKFEPSDKNKHSLIPHSA